MTRNVATRTLRWLAPLLILTGGFVLSGWHRGEARAAYVPRTRVYYLAAEAVEWNYAPTRVDPGPWGHRTRYPKVRFIGYSDERFTTRTPEAPWQGILGPTIRGVVGDTLKVVLWNTSQMPVSLHAHGVRYSPEDEGVPGQHSHAAGDALAPGEQHTYTLIVRPEAGPLPGEPSSKVWLYHSHVHSDQDIYRGLIGTIVVTDPAHARDDGGPDDVDREFALLWMIFDENTPNTPPREQEGNLKHAINGYLFGNLPGLSMREGERVRWYVVALGNEVDVHTAHWHGSVLKVEGRTYTDVIELAPASMRVADLVPDNPGTWLLHCHVSDHMMAGMYTTYTITPRAAVAARAP
jgi:FtsP/CotA-like multicopper oxidase with cupredoxin domain